MDNDTLEKVLAYIEAHIRQRISLCDLSEIAGYSPFYFSKLFSEVMGMPVTGYIRIRKLQHAVVALLEGNKVLDVALMFAFDSHEGFTRSFTQLFGSTPSTVRRFLTSYTVPKYTVPEISNRRALMASEKTTDLHHNMHQLIFEVLGNSLEEARAGYCTQIEIVLLPDNRIRLADNGRGLPLSEDLHVSQVVLDKILAGQPITNAEYSQMGDLAEAGMQTVNSLCDTLQVTVNRNGNQFRQDYVRGIAQHDLQIGKTAHPSGMEIVLRPDKSIFGETEFSGEVIRSWITEKSSGIEHLEINMRTDTE